MSIYKPIDSKREDFRKYLERSGVMDALTKVLVLLYEQPEKPEDGLEFMRTKLVEKLPSATEIENLKIELEEAKQTIRDLEKQLQLTKTSLSQTKQQLAAQQRKSSKGAESDDTEKSDPK